VEIQLHAFIALTLGRDGRSVSYTGLFTSEDTDPLFSEWELSVFQSGSGNSGEWTPTVLFSLVPLLLLLLLQHYYY